MTKATITQLSSTSLSLPKTWKGSRVLFRVTNNTITITKISTAGDIFTGKEIRSFRKLGKKIPKMEIAKTLGKR